MNYIIRLTTKGISSNFKTNILGKVTFEPILDQIKRKDYILVLDEISDGLDTNDYAAIVTSQKLNSDLLSKLEVPVLHSVEHSDHFSVNDVLLLDTTGHIRTLYRPTSRFNTIFTTDRCNSYCLMCSQPPIKKDDSERIIEHLRLIDLIDPKTEQLGITGGEPTLLRDDLLKIIGKCKEILPNTRLHMLTNGKMFYYSSFAEKLAAIGHPNLTLGIPLYSDMPTEHDYVVQSKGAFEQTTIGYYNLARFNQKIEIRVVLHALTYKRLPQLAEYIYRNFPFVVHIALMGLEIMGFTRPNLKELWIDPYDYQDELEEAVFYLANRGMNVSIYNHQLCVLKPSLWKWARQSISDYKNLYLDECNKCAVKEKCGGLFSSAEEVHSKHIKAFEKDPECILV